MLALIGSSKLQKLALFALVPTILLAQSNPPRIFYSDIDSGPNSGGENNVGAYVTIYGSGFGNGTSTVTVGGGPVAQYRSWTDTKITVALGASASTGNIVVSTNLGTSNGVPFTVRAGNIYFVATNGNDSANGSFAAPWQTMLKARDTITAGDIVYARNGVAQTTDDGEGWNSCFTIGGKSGTAANPIALLVYPGESATIGNISGCSSGIRSKGQGENYWTIAGFNLRGQDEAMTSYGATNWRVIGNDMTCPNGNGASACYETSVSTYLKIYGNNVHDTGVVNASALYHGVYFSTDSNHIDFGWNTIANVRGCRGLQIHSSPLTGGGTSDPTGHDQFDLKIHDNVIHDTQCDGIILATVDPSKGAVEVFNNIIYNAGKGPNNPEGSGSWSCIHVQGWTNSGPAGSGTIDVYSNTMHSCGTFSNPPYLGGNAGVFMSGPNANKKLRLRNNIISLSSNIPFVDAEDGNNGNCTSCSRVTGSNNLFFGSTLQPTSSFITISVNSNPLFVSAAAADFHLSSGSPAAESGINVGLSTDLEGKLLPQGSGFPIGALELGTGGPATINVSVTPGSTTLQPNQTQAFTALVTATQNTAVTWSLTPAVGSLSATGVYTAPSSIPAAQTVIVTAKSVADPARTANATISLTPPAIVAVQISPASISLTGSQTQQYSATVTGSTNTAVTWTVTPAIGTLSATGLYTAPASITTAQTVMVTATSVADPTKSATATVSLTVPVVIAVQLSPASVTRSSSQAQQFAATVTGSTNTAVTWSMTPALGTLSATGLYTAPSTITTAQTVIVTAQSVADPTKSAIATVSLTATLVVAVQMSPASVSRSSGQTQQFVATVTGATNTSVTWSIAPAIGTLSATGFYTAPSSITTAQTVIVTAQSVADPTKSGIATVSLTSTPVVAVQLTPTSISLAASQSRQFSALVTGSTNTSVTWSMSPVLGSLSATGLYTSPASITAAQNVLVTAKSAADPTKSATAIVALTIPVAVSIQLSPASITIAASQSRQFTATVNGSTNTAVSWSRSPAIGTISASGLYTSPSSITVGQSVIVTAQSIADPAKIATALVALLATAPPIGSVAMVEIAPAASSIAVGTTKQFTATTTGLPSTAATWSISPATGTISPAGLYSAPMALTSAQTVTVKATSVANPTISASATVMVSPVNNLKLSLQSLGGRLVRVSWIAPSGRPVKDWIGLSGSGAPNWWTLWSGVVGGQTSGSFDVTLPSTPGIYEFRYYSNDTFQVLATSEAIPVDSVGYSVMPALVSVNSSRPVQFTYTAANPMPDDCVALVPVGKPTESMAWYVPTNGAKSGTGQSPGVVSPGRYELRYLTQGGYVSVVISPPIDIL